MKFIETTGITTAGNRIVATWQYFDIDGDSRGESHIQWFKDGAPITSANSKDYHLTLDDVNSQIHCVVTPIALSGAKEGFPKSSIPFLVNNSNPRIENLEIREANGNPISVDSTLKVIYQYIDIEGDEEGATRFKWFRDGNPISFANQAEYTVSVEDIGSQLQVEVTPVAVSGDFAGNAFLSASVTTDNTAPMAK